MSTDVCSTSGETTLEGNHGYSNTVDSLNDHEEQRGGAAAGAVGSGAGGNEQNTNFQTANDCHHLLQEHTHAHQQQQQQHVQYHQGAAASQLHEQERAYQNAAFHLRDSGGHQNPLLPPMYLTENPTSTTIPAEMLAQLATGGSSAFVANNQGNCTKSGTKKARRKFTPSSVWNHFLRLSDGNVHCVHCGKVLKRKDSSTKTMWGHLKAIHFRGKDWIALQEECERRRLEMANENENLEEPIIPADSAQSWLEKQLGLRDSPQNDAMNKNDPEGRTKNGTPPQAYYVDGTQAFLKQIRYSPYEIPAQAMLKNHCQMDVSVRNGQNVTHDNVGAHTNLNEKSDNVLSLISHSSEVINITAGFNGQEGEKRDCSNEMGGGTELGADCTTPISSGESILNQMDATRASHPEQALARYHQYMFLKGKTPLGFSFSIMEGDFVVKLMNIAAQMDYTFSFHCMGGEGQLCFEPNPDSYSFKDKRKPQVALFELGNDVKVVERFGGVDVGSECWRKIDRTQFLWAVRGKCQQVFLKYSAH